MGRFATHALWVACTASAGCYDLGGLRAGAGGSRCGDLGVQLCESFESGVLDPRWRMVGHNVTVSVDDSFAFRGTHSLRIDGMMATSGDVQGEILESDTLPATDIFMRGYWYFPSTTPPTAIRLMTPFQTDAPFTGVGLSVAARSSGFVPETFNGVTGMTTSSQLPGFAVGRWVCIEWEVLAGAPGRTRVWVDDVEYGDLATMQNTNPTPPFGTIGFGMLHASGAPAHSIWLDDLDVDTQRITCAR
ncbi:MAG: hypothetical protein JWN44_5573 [Myxococcales bacterium]|nr:hypothetical protein [Myxococcales bacterium]